MICRNATKSTRLSPSRSAPERRAASSKKPSSSKLALSPRAQPRETMRRTWLRRSRHRPPASASRKSPRNSCTSCCENLSSSRASSSLLRLSSSSWSWILRMRLTNSGRSSEPLWSASTSDSSLMRWGLHSRAWAYRGKSASMSWTSSFLVISPLWSWSKLSNCSWSFSSSRGPKPKLRRSAGRLRSRWRCTIATKWPASTPSCSWRVRIGGDPFWSRQPSLQNACSWFALFRHPFPHLSHSSKTCTARRTSFSRHLRTSFTNIVKSRVP
mmetsp:Transcript_57617/g.151636  ORF Transcript_57617/g.151636 Transcript_57617/m.151636 type:complete len:270 (-) Transcript_57617:402-1211(-)